MTNALPASAEIHGEFLPVRRSIPWAAIGAAVIILAFALFLITHFAPATSEPDDNGYFAQGSLIAQTGHSYFVPQSNAQYVGMHWLVLPNSDVYISRYPPGMPLAIAALYDTLGYKAATFLNPLLSILALIGMYQLGRRILTPGWALVGVALLAANPTFFHHALACDSHMGVLVALVWGVDFLLAWSQHGKLWQIFLAGLILGTIPTVRYPDGLAVVGIAVFMLWHARRFPHIWRHYLVAIIAAAIPILPLLIRNQLLLGAFWRTGYSLTNEETGFAWSYFVQHYLEYLTEMQSSGLGSLFGIGLIGMAGMIAVRNFRRLGVMLALLTIPSMLLYMAYYWGPEQNAQATLRFIVPTFPLYILAGVWGLMELCRMLPRGARVAIPLVLLGLQAAWGVTVMVDQANQLYRTRTMYALVTDALDKVAGKNDVVVASGQLDQDLDFVRHYKVADTSVLRDGGFGGGGGGGRGRFGGAGGANAPSPRQAAKSVLRSDLYTGSTSERMDQFSADVVKWAGSDGSVYVVGTDQDLDRTLDGGRAAMTIVATVKLPAEPAREDDRNGRNRGGNNRRGRGGFGGGGFPGGFPGGGGGGGGMFGNPFANESEVLIAKYTPPKPGSLRPAADDSSEDDPFEPPPPPRPRPEHVDARILAWRAAAAAATQPSKPAPGK